MASWTPRRPFQESDSLGGTFSQTTCQQTPISSRAKKQSESVRRQYDGYQVHMHTAAFTICLFYVADKVLTMHQKLGSDGPQGPFQGASAIDTLSVFAVLHRCACTSV